MINFVRITLNIIDYNSDEALFVIIMSNDLFQAIREDINSERCIHYNDLLDYFTEVFWDYLEFFLRETKRIRLCHLIMSYSLVKNF